MLLPFMFLSLLSSSLSKVPVQVHEVPSTRVQVGLAESVQRARRQREEESVGIGRQENPLEIRKPKESGSSGKGEKSMGKGSGRSFRRKQEQKWG